MVENIRRSRRTAPWQETTRLRPPVSVNSVYTRRVQLANDLAEKTLECTILPFNAGAGRSDPALAHTDEFDEHQQVTENPWPRYPRHPRRPAPRPQHRRDHDADLRHLDLCAAEPGRAQGLRILAHPESDTNGLWAVRGGSGR